MTSRFQRRICALLPVAALTLLASAGALAAGNPHAALFAGATRAGNEGLPVHAQPDTAVEGDLNPAAQDAAGLSIMLADGRQLQARRQSQVEDSRRASKTWVGTFDDQPGSLIVVTRYKGMTTGFVSYGTETYEIAPGRGGKQLLYKVNPARMPRGEEVRRAPQSADSSSGSSDYGLGGATPDAGGGVVQDLLVVYTPASKARHGQASIESQIISAVAAANQAYQNSQVGITLNLVAMYEAPFSEAASTGSTLDLLQANTTVRNWRDQHAADVVIGIGENTDACGMAWMMTSPGSGFAPYAYGQVYSSCLSNHSLAHEVGHIQGNQHDRDSSASWGPGAYPYSYGFRRCMTDGTGFRTVMSYSCSGANRVTQFSNPGVNYNGYPTGISYESNPNQSADNARSMNNTAPITAAFRGGSSGNTAPAAPSALSATAGSSTSVTVRWTDNSSNETGFKLERSSNGVDFSLIASLGAGTTSFNDNGVVASSNYWYRVRAWNSVGNSAYSNTGSVTTPGQPPAVPGAVAAVNNANGSATVTWSAVANAASYEVVRETWDSRRARWKGRVTVATVPASMLVIVDEVGAGTYRYEVRATNGGGASGWGGPAQVAVTGGTTGGGGGGKGQKDQPPGKTGKGGGGN